MISDSIEKWINKITGLCTGYMTFIDSIYDLESIHIYKVCTILMWIIKYMLYSKKD